MGLARLVYASRATSRFSPEQLGELVRHCSSSNSAKSVSGALIYGDGYFVQLLEGQESTLIGLFAKISGDRRHRDVQQLSLRPILSRSFADWGMSLLHEENALKDDKTKIAMILSRLHSAPCLEELGDDAAKLLEELKTAIVENSEAAGLLRAA